MPLGDSYARSLSLEAQNDRKGVALEDWNDRRKSLVLILGVCLLFVGVNEVRAEEESSGNIVNGTCNDAGTCLWSFDTNSGKMTISAAEGAGKVAMGNYKCSGRNCNTTAGNRPWEAYVKQIKNLVVEDNITNIGNRAFNNADYLETVTGMKDVKTIGASAFGYNYALKSIEMPNVETLGQGVFHKVQSLKSIDLPNVKKIDGLLFCTDGANSTFRSPIEYVGLPEGQEVTISDKAFQNTSLIGCSNTNRAACGSCGYTQSGGYSYIKSGVGCVKHCGEGFVGKEGKCVSDENGCGTNFRQIDDWCNRTRYTPAEAAEVLNNNNTNFVTITFRK